MIAIPDGMRRPAEVERDELRKQFSDANALIKSINDNHQRYVKDSTEHAMNLELELAEARAAIKRKDKLIEQMRGALRLADDLIDDYATDYEHRDNVDDVRDKIKDALRAADGGE